MTCDSAFFRVRYKRGQAIRAALCRLHGKDATDFSLLKLYSPNAVKPSIFSQKLPIKDEYSESLKGLMVTPPIFSGGDTC
jgi:hypothetical protein